MNNTAQHIPNTSGTLQKTPLHALHIARGGKMVPFAGYDMPVQYDGMGVMKEHLHTRSAAGLFDVSHMGQALLSATDGSDPAVLLETLVPGDMQGLAIGQTRYTLLLNGDGGIIDDLMVTRLDAHLLFLVVNAACKEKDFAHIAAKLGGDAHLEYLAERALLALQGPKAAAALAPFFGDLADMTFMTLRKVEYKGREVFLGRSSYAGEDGFEISIPAAHAEEFTQALLAQDGVALIGLGARDSLRLEAGLCLYGHDIDDTTTPVEANLKWVIPKRRRAEANFPGAQKILAQLENGAPRLRVGIAPDGRAPVREGTALVDDAGRAIGVITSGGFGPTTDAPVAMGYVEPAFAVPGTKINALLRGTPRPCTVAALPFVKHTYKKD